MRHHTFHLLLEKLRAKETTAGAVVTWVYTFSWMSRYNLEGRQFYVPKRKMRELTGQEDVMRTLRNLSNLSFQRGASVKRLFAVTDAHERVLISDWWEPGDPTKTRTA